MKTITSATRPTGRHPQRRTDQHKVVVVGASAGGIEAFRALARELPADFPASICLVIHISPTGPSLLPRIFSQATRLRVAPEIKHGDPLKPGHIYIAPPDFHLLLEPNRLHLVRGPAENRHRPAIDPLFRSAANAFGPHAIGVLLSGNLDDGTAGLSAIKECGGIAVVQDPKDAMYPNMPRNALESIKVDYSLPLSEMPPLLSHLVQEPNRRRNGAPVLARVAIETEVDEMKRPMNDMEGLGKPSTLTCPHCHGVLWETQAGKLLRYRCRVGHAFSAENLEASQSEQLEVALWSAVRALEEKANLLQCMSERARKQKHRLTAQQFEKRFRGLEPSVKVLRSMLLKASY